MVPWMAQAVASSSAGKALAGAWAVWTIFHYLSANLKLNDLVLAFGLLLTVAGLLIVLLLPGRPGSRWKLEGPLPKRTARR